MALDKDGDGDISVAELGYLLQSVKRKLKMRDKEIKNLLEEIDQNGDGSIDIAEFLDMLEHGNKRDTIQKALVERSRIRQTFAKYDTDGNGVITMDEFKKVVEDKYQSRVTPSQLEAIMVQADTNKSGTIDYEEFVKSFAYFPVSEDAKMRKNSVLEIPSSTNE